MRKHVFHDIALKTLNAVISGNSRKTAGNPALTFTKAAKQGKMDAISDEDYQLLLEEVEEIASWWHNEPDCSYQNLFQCLLEAAEPEGESVERLVEVLSEAYRETACGFTPELSDPDYQFDPVPEGAPELSDPDCQFDPAPEGAPERVRDIDRSPYPSINDYRPAPNPYASDPQMKTPMAIYDYITTHIHGQRDACRAAANLLYHHVHGHRRTMIMAGPTGCGKTEIWRVCKDIYPHIIVVDSSQLTAEGWSGSFKVRDIFDGLSTQDIERSIVVFDEFDKLCEPKISSSGTNFSHIEQNNILKLIEGGRIHFPQDGPKSSPREALDFNSSCISFVFLGSFENLTEVKSRRTAMPSLGFGHDLKKQDAYDEYSRTITLDDVAKYSGMRREIAGRIGAVVQLQAMTEKDFFEILHDDILSPIRRLEREYHIHLRMDDALLHELASEAASNHMGVRFLNSRVQDMLDKAMFQHPELESYTIKATPPVPAYEQEGDNTP